MIKNKKVYVVVRDSLGAEVSSYPTWVDVETYDRLSAEAEECDLGPCLVRDCLVDDEMGWKEIYL